MRKVPSCFISGPSRWHKTFLLLEWADCFSGHNCSNSRVQPCPSGWLLSPGGWSCPTVWLQNFRVYGGGLKVWQQEQLRTPSQVSSRRRRELKVVLNSILTFSTVHDNEVKTCSFTQYISSSLVCHCAGY